MSHQTPNNHSPKEKRGASTELLVLPKTRNHNNFNIVAPKHSTMVTATNNLPSPVQKFLALRKEVKPKIKEQKKGEKRRSAHLSGRLV